MPRFKSDKRARRKVLCHVIHPCEVLAATEGEAGSVQTLRLFLLRDEHPFFLVPNHISE